MILKKKLIEVALPLEAIDRGCDEDKNRKTGHIRNVHKWFAPMPLPAWRAMLFASLVDDPAGSPSAREERARLLDIVSQLSRFDSHTDARLLRLAREEITKATGGTEPVVIDPFCGGGSTVVEAQRLGLQSEASDLNQVPVLITTVLCRAAALFSQQEAVRPGARSFAGSGSPLDGLKEDVAHYAARVRQRAHAKLQAYYPADGSGTPYAYRWAWAVASPDPFAQGKYTPLISDWWLSKHKRTRAWIHAEPKEDGIAFSIKRDGNPPKGTTSRTSVRCLYTNTPIPLEYVRSEGRASRLRLMLLAVASRHGGDTVYTAPTTEQINASRAPDIDNPGIIMPEAALSFRVQQYGIRNFRDLFTQRQRFSLATFAEEVRRIHGDVEADARSAGLPADGVSLEDDGRGARAYADAVTAILGLCVSRMAQANSILGRWFIDPRNGAGKITPAFDRHAIPMVWDFSESNPFGGSVGDWAGPVLETVIRGFDLIQPRGPVAVVRQRDARMVAPNMPTSSLVATDPPYFANIGYADLSDFFYLWLREALRGSFPKLFATIATPKTHELIATPFRHGGDSEAAGSYFRDGFADVFGALSRSADPRFPMLVVYAIKQSEDSEAGVRATGWEVFLGGLIDAGVSVVATWPIRTTTDTRMIGLGTNALASAVVVVGRRRPDDAPKITRGDFVRELRRTLPDALASLSAANTAPVDLAQAAIGPGMAVYSRCAAVLDSNGKAVTVGEALALISQAVDEVLAQGEADLDNDTRWAVTWFEQCGFEDGEYGQAEILSKAKNTSVEGLVESGLVSSKRGKVRLLRPSELQKDWDPTTDTRLTVWEVVHHTIRRLDGGGENAASILAAKMGGAAELIRDLCYRLYTICERKKWSTQAILYNTLVQSWPEIIRLARTIPGESVVSAGPAPQTTMFDDAAKAKKKRSKREN